MKNSDKFMWETAIIGNRDKLGNFEKYYYTFKGTLMRVILPPSKTSPRC